MLELLKGFPPIRHAVAYGSSILSRTPDPTRQLDFIFLVDDSVTWHTDNFKANTTHYSSKARKMGPKALAVSAREAAGFHYNPYVKINDKICKYGVVDVTRAQSDLQKWDTFYLAGRLHKPVVTLVEDKSLVPLLRKNLTTALAIGLLTIPQTVAESDLYIHIAKLSYLGDPRPEEAGKVERIVQDNYAEFRQLYAPSVEALSDFVEWENGVIERKGDLKELAKLVPSTICARPEALPAMELTVRRESLFKGIEFLNDIYIRKQYRHYMRTTELRDILAYSFRKLKKFLSSS